MTAGAVNRLQRRTRRHGRAATSRRAGEVGTVGALLTGADGGSLGGSAPTARTCCTSTRPIGVVRDRARRKGVPPVQVSLAWLMAQKPWIVPIPGTTDPRHLEETLGAVAVRPTPDELREMGAAVERIRLQGVRAPESASKGQ